MFQFGDKLLPFVGRASSRRPRCSTEFVRSLKLKVLNMLQFTRRLAAVAVVVLTASLVAMAPAGAQVPEGFCLGLTPQSAEALGFRVQIGTDGTDVLVGGNTTRDFILGLAGDDILTGAGAGDVICGGHGDDIITAGAGNDRVSGGPGHDDITLGSGNDKARGGWGQDRIVGGAGNDIIWGNGGSDRISGEAGADELHGNLGADVMFGGEGNDLVRGLRGHDKIAGGPGDDRLEGGAGNDIASGDAGDDVVFGGPGTDTLDGDADADRLDGGTGRDRCDVADGDHHNLCDVDFGGGAIESSVEAVQSVESEDEQSGDSQPVAPPEGSAVPAAQAPQGVNKYGWPLLTDAGLQAMLQCESGGDHTINTGNGFYGGVQWLPNTWNAAARGAGFDQYDGVLPHLVPADVQDQATAWWWSATRPNTQWPHCHVLALEAMNVQAP